MDIYKMHIKLSGDIDYLPCLKSHCDCIFFSQYYKQEVDILFITQNHILCLFLEPSRFIQK
jgi:hypothetical protein